MLVSSSSGVSQESVRSQSGVSQESVRSGSGVGGGTGILPEMKKKVVSKSSLWFP